MFNQYQKRGSVPAYRRTGGKVMDVVGKRTGSAVGAVGVVSELLGVGNGGWSVLSWLVEVYIWLWAIYVVVLGGVSLLLLAPSLHPHFASLHGCSLEVLVTRMEKFVKYGMVVVRPVTGTTLCSELPNMIMAVCYVRSVRSHDGGLQHRCVGRVRSHVWWFAMIMFYLMSLLACTDYVVLTMVAAVGSALFAGVIMQHTVWCLTNKYGTVGVDIALVMHFVALVVPMMYLPILFVVSTENIRSDGVITSTTVKKSPVCSAAVSSLATQMKLNLSKLEGVVGLDILGAIGTGGPGVHENESVRMLALLGDRVMSLASVNRALRRGWSVSAESSVSQNVITNAAFTKYYHGCLRQHFPALATRSEKRVGTLIEAIVGAAFISGCTVAEVELFVFTQVLAYQSVDVSDDGKVFDRVIVG